MEFEKESQNSGSDAVVLEFGVQEERYIYIYIDMHTYNEINVL